MSVCLRYARDKDEAQDMVQAGFLRIFKYLKQYKGGSFQSWFKRIMVNESINFFNRTNKGNLTIYCDDIKDIYGPDEDQERFDIIEKLNYDQLLSIIQSLTPAYRTVFNLYAIDGMTHKEIAEKLNISISTSKSNLVRARKILRTKIEDLELQEQKRMLIYA